MAATRPSRPSPSARLPRLRRVLARRLTRRASRALIARQIVSLISLFALLASTVAPLAQPDLAIAEQSFQTFSQQATLTVLSQPVEVQRSSGARDAAASGDTLNVGDRVFTGPGGRAMLTFFQGSEVEVAPDSELMVQAMEQKANGASTVGLGQAVGSTFSKVASLFNPASRFQVNTPAAVAVVRGTELAISQLPNGITTYTCVTGVCEVKSGGKTVELQKGESTFVLPPAPTPAFIPSQRTAGGTADVQPTEEAPVPALSTVALGNALATAASTAAARATATPGPTSTPGPSPTPQPTSTEGPSPTPQSTSTPATSPTPVATSTTPPSTTPAPSSTTAPSSTPQPPEDTPVPATSTPLPTNTPAPSPTPSPTATANTQPGASVTAVVSAGGTTASVTFANVVSGGETALTTSSPSSYTNPPSGTFLNGAVYTLSTSATLSGGFDVAVSFDSSFLGTRAASDVVVKYVDSSGTWHAAPSQSVTAGTTSGTYTITASFSGPVGGMSVQDSPDSSDSLVTRLFGGVGSFFRSLFSSLANALTSLVAPAAAEAAVQATATSTPAAPGEPTPSPSATGTAAAPTLTPVATTTATQPPSAATATGTPIATATAVSTATAGATATTPATPTSVSGAATAASSPSATATIPPAATTTATALPSATATTPPLRAAVTSSTTLVTLAVVLPATPTVTHTLTLTKTGTGSGYVSASDSSIVCGPTCTSASATYAAGTSLALYATADSNASFTSWGGDCAVSGSSTSCALLIDGAKSVTADFSYVTPTYPLSITKLGDGASYASITSSPPGLTCNTSCTGTSYPFTLGDTVALSAALSDPRAGFLGWDTGCSGTASCTVTIGTQGNVVGATFQAPPTGTYAAAVLSHSPASYWRLGEVTGTVTIDGSGNQRHGTHSGVSLLQQGAIVNDSNMAAGFNGAGSVTVPTFSLPGPITVEAWVYYTSATPTQFIVSKSPVNTNWQLFLEGGYVVWAPGSGCCANQTKVAAPSANAWHHLVVVQSGTTASIYVDGLLQTPAVTPTSAQAIADGAGSILIGRSSDGHFFSGQIDDVAIYSTALTQADVQAHYTASGRTVANNRVVSTEEVWTGTNSYDNVTIYSGGKITHAPGDSTLQINVSGTLTIHSGGSIDVSAKGCPGGSYGSWWSGAACTAGGASSDYSGGSYGGLGGASSGTPNATYGSAAAPAELGAGGASYCCANAGAGGGRLKISAGSIVLDGAILANGAAAGDGAGSGGAIWLDTATLSGASTGSISASGGASTYHGGGGGGRIALYASSAAYFGTTAAVGGSGPAAGAAGSIYRYAPGASAGTLTIDAGSISAPTAPTPLEVVPSGTHVELRNRAVRVASGALTLGNLSLSNNAALTHAAGDGSLVIGAANVTVDSTSAIDLDFKGCPGGSYGSWWGGAACTAGGASSGYSGGSYGGLGGASSGSPNAAYGDPAAPAELGASGASYCCAAAGAGGGRLKLTATSLSLDGAIRANGRPATDGPGSGGAIWLDLGTLSGTGAGGGLQANGGASTYHGGGGGGRIAVYATTSTYAGVTTASAGAGPTPGGAGTVYRMVPKSGGTPTLTLSAALGSQAGLTPLTTTSAFTSGLELIVTSNAYADLTVPAGIPTMGAIIVDGAASKMDVRSTALAPLRATSLIVRSGATVSHPAVSSTSHTGLHLSASTVSVLSGSAIDVSGKGCPGGSYGSWWGGAACTAGGASSGYSGGSYGGLGGASSGSPNAAYGYAADPAEVGAGGASYCCANAAAGGGLVRIAAGSIVLDGAIRANGIDAGDGAGSGGGIRLDAATLSGLATGSITASGGASTYHGAGGGGRIAILADDAGYDGTAAAMGGSGPQPAAAGSIYRRAPAATTATLTVDAGNVSAPLAATPLESLPSGTNVILRRGALRVATGALTLGNLSLALGGTLTHAAGDSSLFITASAVTIDSASAIDLDFKGCPGGSYGSWWGGAACAAGGASSGYSGGSYGGLGGASSGTPNAVYGSASAPAEVGAGGASYCCANAGAGGGRLKLAASSLALDGAIKANGAAAGDGAGSGGAIWLDLGAFSGSGAGGGLVANGGASTYHGGGGGGRIALYATSSTYAGPTSAAGGSGPAPGAPGSVVTGIGTYAQSVLADSPVAYWRLGEPISATTALDSSGRAHTGTYTGSISLGQTGAVSTSSDTAVTFHSVNDYVSVPDSTAWAFGSGAFTVEFWTRLTGLSNTFFLGTSEGVGATTKWVVMRHDGQLRFHFTGHDVVSHPWSAVTDRWYHAAVTRTSGGDYALYVDGQVVATATNTTPVPDASAPLTIGQVEGANFVNGSMDEVAIYPTALSASRIQAHYIAAQP